jgi:hypothetical protein
LPYRFCLLLDVEKPSLKDLDPTPHILLLCISLCLSPSQTFHLYSRPASSRTLHSPTDFSLSPVLRKSRDNSLNLKSNHLRSPQTYQPRDLHFSQHHNICTLPGGANATNLQHWPKMPVARTRRDPNAFPTAQLFLLSLVRVSEPIAIVRYAFPPRTPSNQSQLTRAQHIPLCLGPRQTLRHRIYSRRRVLRWHTYSLIRFR